MLLYSYFTGSLWTLPIEFGWYIIFDLALSLARSWKTVLVLFFCAAITTLIAKQINLNYAFYSVSIVFLAMFGVAFTAGALMAMTQKHWFPVRGYLAIVALILIFVARGRPDMHVLCPLSVAALTVVVGTSFRDKIINGRFDLSYGIYIYAFPIQQMVINLITQKFWLSMGISIICTVFMAYLSYQFVEKPFLRSSRLKKRAQLNQDDLTVSTKDLA